MSDLSRRSLVKGLLGAGLLAATPDEILFYATPPELRKKFFFFERQPNTVSFTVSNIRPGDLVGVYLNDGEELWRVERVVSGNELTLDLEEPEQPFETTVRVRRSLKQGAPIVPFSVTVPPKSEGVHVLRMPDTVVDNRWPTTTNISTSWPKMSEVKSELILDKEEA